VKIREATPDDLEATLTVEQAAFGDLEGPIIVALVADLMQDSSAEPRLSLLAWDGDEAVGHILFTYANVSGNDGTDKASILAPLGVIPSHQKQGIGERLIETGATFLAQQGVELIFVLGWPDYYARFNFTPAGALGFDAPYPIDPANAGAWMVREQAPGAISRYEGTVSCARTLNREELWRE